MSPPKKEILILGGGIIGCTTAYYLTRHPSYSPSSCSVTIIEATGIASGASGRAGGLLATWAYPSALARLSFRLHAELAEEHDGEGKWGFRRVDCGEVKIRGRRVDEKGENEGGRSGDGDGDDPGGLHHASKPKSMKSSKSTSPRIPADLDWILNPNITAYEEMSGSRDTAQVDPYEFTTSMAALAREKGVKIIMGTAKGINYRTNAAGERGSVESVTVIPTGDQEKQSDAAQTADSEMHESNPDSNQHMTFSNSPITIPATHIILTLGPWTKSLLPTCPISSARAHSVVLRPRLPVSAHVLFSEISMPLAPTPSTSPKNRIKKKPSSRSVTVTVTPEIYPRPSGTIYTCGPTQPESEIPLPPSTALVNAALDPSRCADLVAQMAAVSDVMRDAEVVGRGVCYLPTVTESGVGGGRGPVLGRMGISKGMGKGVGKGSENGDGDEERKGGVFVGTGHTCWGINNGPASGWVLARCVFGVVEGQGEEEIMSGLEECEAWRYGL